MMEIGARPVFNSDHDIFRASVRKFFNEECVPFHDKWEEKGEVDRELWLKAGEQGLLGTDSSEEHHGIGGDFKDAAIVMEESRDCWGRTPVRSTTALGGTSRTPHRHGGTELRELLRPGLRPALADRDALHLALRHPGAD